MMYPPDYRPPEVSKRKRFPKDEPSGTPRPRRPGSREVEHILLDGVPVFDRNAVTGQIPEVYRRGNVGTSNVQLGNYQYYSLAAADINIAAAPGIQQLTFTGITGGGAAPSWLTFPGPVITERGVYQITCGFGWRVAGSDPGVNGTIEIDGPWNLITYAPYRYLYGAGLYSGAAVSLDLNSYQSDDIPDDLTNRCHLSWDTATAVMLIPNFTITRIAYYG